MVCVFMVWFGPRHSKWGIYFFVSGYSSSFFSYILRSQNLDTVFIKVLLSQVHLQKFLIMKTPATQTVKIRKPSQVVKIHDISFSTTLMAQIFCNYIKTHRIDAWKHRCEFAMFWMSAICIT